MATLKPNKPAAKTTANPGQASAKTSAPASKKTPVRAAPSKTARPAARAAAKPAATKPVWLAPADFKPAFFMFSFDTDDQALLTPESLTGTRYRGRWDNEDAKTYDMRTYDFSTLIGFGARISAAIWAPNVLRRITPNASWQIVVRVNRRAANGSLSVRIIGVSIKREGKKLKWFEDKTDPDFRKIRRSARWLSAAFTDVQLPPSPRRKPKEDEEA